MTESIVTDSGMAFLFQQSHQVVRRFVQEAPGRIAAKLDDTIYISNTPPDWDPQDEESMGLLSDGNYKPTLERNLQTLKSGHGSWIMRNGKLTEWLHAAKSQLLWLHGDMGIGKTTATTVLTRELLSLQKLRDKFDIKPDQESRHSSNLLAYFFCERSESKQQSAALILSNFLHHILQQRPDFTEIVRYRFKEWQKPEYFSSQGGLKDLWSIICELLNHRSVKTAYLIIDGLDAEIPLRDELLSLLQPYIDGIPQTVRQIPPNQKLPTGSAQPLHCKSSSPFPNF
jgi:hypothetical protein